MRECVRVKAAMLLDVRGVVHSPEAPLRDRVRACAGTGGTAPRSRPTPPPSTGGRCRSRRRRRRRRPGSTPPPNWPGCPARRSPAGSRRVRAWVSGRSEATPGRPSLRSCALIVARDPPRAKIAIRANALRKDAVEYRGPRDEPSLLNAQYSFQCPFISGIGRTYTSPPKPASAPFRATSDESARPCARSSGGVPPVLSASIGTGRSCSRIRGNELLW